MGGGGTHDEDDLEAVAARASGVGLHACEPRARIQPLGRCPEPTEVMNPLQCVCVCEPRGGIAGLMRLRVGFVRTFFVPAEA